MSRACKLCYKSSNLRCLLKIEIGKCTRVRIELEKGVEYKYLKRNLSQEKVYANQDVIMFHKQRVFCNKIFENIFQITIP